MDVSTTAETSFLSCSPLRSSRIRVVHVVGKWLGGGVESMLMTYYRHIDRSQVQFDFIVDQDSTLVPSEEIKMLGGRIFTVPPYQNLPAYLKALRRLFQNEEWSIVHSHINTLSLFPLWAAKQAGVPIRIAHSHSTLGKGETKKNIIKRALKPFANIYPTKRFACSVHAGRWLFGAKRGFEVIENAIDLTDFLYDDVIRAQCRASWGVSSDQIVIGHLGRLCYQKNQEFLIEVLEDLLLRGMNAVLVLGGEGPNGPFLEDKIEQKGLLNRVIMPGQIESKEAYSAFDIFVFPSRYEGFGIAALEAQLSGLPIVISDNVPQDVIVSSNAKRIPLAGGARCWADQISELIKAPVSRNVTLDSFGKFDIRKEAPRLVGLYQSYEANL